ncbi:MAG: hypothetical protein L3J97_00310 [Thermoplasmata archaeon]|nr:hypothetical protein [Thermoplasmata archaeon]
MTIGAKAPVEAPPKYRSLGRVLLVLSIPLLIPGIVFQLYPTVRGCTGFDFFGYCSQMGPVHPYAGAGDLMLFFFAVSLIFGLVFFYWRPSEPFVPPVVDYVPYHMPPPPPPVPASQQWPGQPGVVVQVQQAPAPTPKILTRCRNCGNMFDLVAGRCDRCGAPAS